MRLFVPLLISQLSHLAVLGQETDSEFSEIDLIIPTPNTVYEVGDNHRFPIVWAIRNPSVWKDSTVITWRLDNATEAIDASNSRQGDATFSTNETSDGTSVRYATTNALLIAAGKYHLTWKVSSDNFRCRDMPNWKPPDTKVVSFSTKPGGEKADFMSAASSHCANRTGLAYNIANISDYSCHVFDEGDPFPDPTPCDLVVDVASVANITKGLDAEYNKTCSDRYFSPLCPQPAEKKSLATQVGVGMWLVVLPVLSLFL